MPILLADENFRGPIIRGIQRRRPQTIIIRVQEVGLRGADDASILAWAAARGYVLLTHDRRTIEVPAYARVLRGERMPGVLVVKMSLSTGAAIEQIILVLECTFDNEWEGSVRQLPL